MERAWQLRWRAWGKWLPGLGGLLLLVQLLMIGITWQYMYGSRHSNPDQLPDALNLPYEQISFLSAQDHVSLAGWLIPANMQGAVGGQAAIILVHGHHQNMGRKGRENYLTYVAKPLHEAGFHVLLFDLRNHGMSQDAPPVTLGYFESRDALGAIAFLQNHPSLWQGSVGPIGLWGSSMGAVTTLYALADIAARQGQVESTILGAWLDSPFARADEPIRMRLTRDGVPWLLQETLLGLTPILGPIDYREITPIAKMELAAKVPLYFVHAEQDDVIAANDSKALYAAAKQFSPGLDHRLVISPATTHVGAAQYDPKWYQTEVVAFFSKQLQRLLGQALPAAEQLQAELPAAIANQVGKPGQLGLPKQTK